MNPSNTSVSFRPCDLRVMALLKGFVFIMESRPLLSWKISSDRTGFRQSAYRILGRIGQNGTACRKRGSVGPDVWSPIGRCMWNGAEKELASRQHVCWQVTVWDENGMESEASEIAEFEIALQHNAEWEARWIHFDGNNPACSSPSPYFRHEFSCGKEIAKARLYVTARGLFETRINGKRIGNDYFVPGWTDFSQQIQYMSYDITGSLKSGNNTIGAILGDGWYCGYLSGRRRNLYGAYRNSLRAWKSFTRTAQAKRSPAAKAGKRRQARFSIRTFTTAKCMTPVLRCRGGTTAVSMTPHGAMPLRENMPRNLRHWYRNAVSP